MWQPQGFGSCSQGCSCNLLSTELMYRSAGEVSSPSQLSVLLTGLWSGPVFLAVSQTPDSSSTAETEGTHPPACPSAWWLGHTAEQWRA